MVTRPFRFPPVALGATAMLTTPLPIPASPAVIVIQFALLEACQAHPASEVTVKFPEPPEDFNLPNCASMENEQLALPPLAASAITVAE